MRKIQKTSLCDQLIATIIDLIKEGEWTQGSKLSGEIELASSFNVSRNIMREALKILENFGVLESRNGVGTFVSENSIENIQGMNFFYNLKENNSIETILELRLAIEPAIVYYAALRITDEEILELDELSNKLLKQYNTDSGYFEDFYLHRACAHYCKNPLFESLCESLLKQLENSMYADFHKYSSEKTIKDNMDTHIRIVKAIVNHDADVAQELMRGHLLRRIKLINPDFESNPQNREFAMSI